MWILQLYKLTLFGYNYKWKGRLDRAYYVKESDNENGTVGYTGRENKKEKNIVGRRFKKINT